MRKCWGLLLLVLWGGCSGQGTLEEVLFYDEGGNPLSLTVSSGVTRDPEGTFFIEPEQKVDIRFQKPFTAKEGADTIRWRIESPGPQLQMVFLCKGGSIGYSTLLPAARGTDDTLTIRLPHGTYEGFRLLSQEKTKTVKVRLIEGRVGDAPLWTRIGEGKIETFSEILPLEIKEGYYRFRFGEGILPLLEKGGIRIHTQAHGNSPYPRLTCTLKGANQTKTVYLRTRPKQEEVVIYSSWLGFTPEFLEIDGWKPAIPLELGVFTPIARDPRYPDPLPADLEGVLSYPVSAWRNPDLEVFRWSLVPEILIFDTKNYTIQNELFHRLAFFVEKKGHRGKLRTDREIGSLHGWNAHNYRPENLADFFNEAKKISFPLNTRERWLAEYLVQQGVLEQKDNQYMPGKGGILSLSRESAEYHRRLLLTHESIHGVFYGSKEYRDVVEALWKGLSSEERKFWFYFLSWMQYDVTDHYLVVNEFHAYLLQQPVSQVDRYFKETVSKRILEKNPEMELFFKQLWETYPDMFRRPAASLSRFLEQALGIDTSTLTTLHFR